MTTLVRKLSLFTALLLVLTSQAAFAGSPAPQEKTDPKSKEKKEDKSILSKIKGTVTGKDDTEEEAELRYRELLTKAKKKYENTAKPGFSRRVDQSYKQKRREHNNYAFQMNTSDSNDELTTFTGDKIKLEDTLYDNLAVQDYINRVGHSLVPPDSIHRYAFKIVLNPVPDARALSTGTIFLTTGLLSLVDTEAQLAYVLAHEIAHIEKRHWLEDAMVAAQFEDEEKDRQKKAALIGAAAAIGGGLAFKSFGNGLAIGLAAGVGTYGLLKFFDKNADFEWELTQENEADEFAMKRIFDRNYDPREVPKLYARLKELTQREPRLADGVIARTERMGERVGYLSTAISSFTSKPSMQRGSSNLRRLRAQDAADSAVISPVEAGKSFRDDADMTKREKEAARLVSGMTPELRLKLEKEEIVGKSEEFDGVMADLKRDNGLRAFYYDMFNIALENLSEARLLRSDDPHSHYYYGKVLQLTAKNRAEKANAFEAFKLAIQHDRRGVLADPWLHKSLIMMSDANPNQNREIIEGLERYVELYQRTHGGGLPPNMDTIYTYLKALGEQDWAAHPVQNVNNARPTEGTRAQDAVAPPVQPHREEAPKEVKPEPGKPTPPRPKKP
ncbi:MAG TPA: M48 family metalloprotease [Blastocatellia bacterium]|nr:M48 family metalloprotease [Blastocatellia bacterium]